MVENRQQMLVRQENSRKILSTKPLNADTLIYIRKSQKAKILAPVVLADVQVREKKKIQRKKKIFSHT